MEQTLTAKVQIYPGEEEGKLLLASMRAYALGCDFVSEYVYETHDLNQASVQKHTYSRLRSAYGLPSQMACNVIRTVIGSYRTLRTNNMPWAKCRYRIPQMTLSWNRDYSITKDGRFSVGTIGGRVKLSYDNAGMEQYFDKSEYRFGAAKVAYKHGKFFLHLSATHDVEMLDVADVRNVVGIDRGIRFIAAAYDSRGKTVFYSGSKVKQKRAHYKELRSELQRVGTPSSRRRLKAIGERENRWMRDVNHCVSKALVESNPEGTMFVLEDLSGVRAATERVRLEDRYVSVSWAYYDLEQKLIYKAEKNHQLVKKVDPAYTSQICPKCGHTEKANRDKKNHIFCCRNCGYSSNDDRIGAMNLHRMGIELIVPDAVTEEHAPS